MMGAVQSSTSVVPPVAAETCRIVVEDVTSSTAVTSQEMTSPPEVFSPVAELAECRRSSASSAETATEYGTNGELLIMQI